MTNDHQTNQLPIVQNESVADAAPAEASTPHFDDIAVAIAQPVQPLAEHTHAIASSVSVLRPLLFALVACVVIATLATAVSLFGLPRHDETSEPPAAPVSEPAEAEISGGILQTNVSTQSEQRRRHRRSTFLRMTPNHVIVVAEDNEGKPGARKVGEIRYNRGTDRP